MEGRDEKITVVGRILVTDMSRQGFITEIVVETDQFEQYVILLDEQGKKLIGFISEWVRIEGIRMERTLQGQPVIRVLNFHKLS